MHMTAGEKRAWREKDTYRFPAASFPGKVGDRKLLRGDSPIPGSRVTDG